MRNVCLNSLSVGVVFGVFVCEMGFSVEGGLLGVGI